MTYRLAITGASGRLGRIIDEVASGMPGIEVVARGTSRDGTAVIDGADGVIDATHLDVSRAIVDRALANGQNIVIGTSGWAGDELAALEKKCAEHPGLGVLLVPNFSIGSVLGTRFAELAAPFFATVDVVESHHEGKKDSPSGTAARTASLIAAARKGSAAAIDAPFSDQAARGELVDGVPVHSLRVRGLSARQEVVYGGTGETLRIEHDTFSPDAYRFGIERSITALNGLRGLRIGLDSIIELP